MPYAPAQRQARYEAKSNIARALTDAGVPSMFCDTIETLKIRARRVFGDPHQGESTIDYFNRVSGLQPRAKSAATGQRVPARTNEPLHARAWTPPRHPRAAEIDALPRPVSMSGRVTTYVGFEERGR
ncbi:hypothetical protein ABRY95_13890 [Castellaniella ginsengisoli]|uniref:Transposase n=1 Tax=Castellaniella ginsengisoli TaxID=546114 RepID=A0AB39GSB1_9BURK